MSQTCTHHVMNVPEPGLFEIAFASYLFSSLPDSDDAYNSFREQVPGEVDLNDPAHLGHLITFLRGMRCRQFTEDGEPHARRALKNWYLKFEHNLPAHGTNIWMLTDPMLNEIQKAYGDLVTVKAGERKNCNYVKVGPTGAAKILFALRPRSLMAWHDKIAACTVGGADAESYVRFLRMVKDMVAKLERECSVHDIRLEQLPERLGRTEAITIPKLIDEYLWQTLTQKRLLPSPQFLGDWRNWSSVGT